MLLVRKMSLLMKERAGTYYRNTIVDEERDETTIKAAGERGK